MGLDMYAWAVDPADLSEQDVVRQVDIMLPTQKIEQLWYWRKHHNLHGWMEGLYREKGGAAGSFNCVTVRLTIEDLDDLERSVKDGVLPETTGFFFGDNPPNEESNSRDMKFISAAKEAIEQGKAVFYDSWW